MQEEYDGAVCRGRVQAELLLPSPGKQKSIFQGQAKVSLSFLGHIEILEEPRDSQEAFSKQDSSLPGLLV
jgi:hypothetical protein